MKRFTFNYAKYSWDGIRNQVPHKFQCGFCNSKISSEKGLRIQDTSKSHPQNNTEYYIYSCPECLMLTFVDKTKNYQFPESMYGRKLNNLVAEISDLYEEAKECYSNQCYTASVMLCRKLLMNISVSEGAEKGKSFIDYVDYLDNNHFIPPKSKDLINKIRKKGNKANHEIENINQNDAKDVFNLTEMILLFLYEYADQED